MFQVKITGWIFHGVWVFRGELLREIVYKSAIFIYFDIQKTFYCWINICSKIRKRSFVSLAVFLWVTNEETPLSKNNVVIQLPCLKCQIGSDLVWNWIGFVSESIRLCLGSYFLYGKYFCSLKFKGFSNRDITISYLYMNAPLNFFNELSMSKR